jgi:hypothetical protein
MGPGKSSRSFTPFKRAANNVPAATYCTWMKALTRLAEADPLFLLNGENLNLQAKGVDD